MRWLASLHVPRHSQERRAQALARRAPHIEPSSKSLDVREMPCADALVQWRRTDCDEEGRGGTPGLKPLGFTPALRAAYDDLRRRLQDG